MSEPVLYIIMRDDLESMNPGKGMAQSSHAYGALQASVRTNVAMQEIFNAWAEQTKQEFGRTVVLAGDEAAIAMVLAKASDLPKSSVLAGWVHDPSYPITDGEVKHIIPLDTCAFVFGDLHEVSGLVASLPLHP